MAATDQLTANSIKLQQYYYAHSYIHTYIRRIASTYNHGNGTENLTVRAIFWQRLNSCHGVAVTRRTGGAWYLSFILLLPVVCICVAALLNAYLCVGALLMKRRKNVCCKNCGNFFGFLQPRLIMVLLPFCCCGYYIFFSLACIVFATRTLHWPWHSFCIICGNE